MPFEHSTAAEVLAEIADLLRCPRTGKSLAYEDGVCSTEDGQSQYESEDGILDLRVPPERIRIDVPWYDPWPELPTANLSYPDVPRAIAASELPHHLSAHQAAIAGTEGAGRLLLEIGCGERHCEPYFTERGFRYVAVDVDKRGPGPHLIADGHNLPFQDESFDLCYAMAVLQHMSCPWLAVQEAQRVLKAGGVFFGAAAFVSPVSDRNAFFHFSYGGLLCLLRSFGFEKVQIWPAWPYYESIPGLSFSRRFDWPWRLTTQLWLTLSEQSYLELSNATRRLVRKQPLDRFMRRVATAGGLNFAAYKPGSTA